jgi:LytS/YehU family sensor histidine kinase
MHALEVESLRREAELWRLRVHLHPHFLLNTLNAIAGLVTEDPAEACRLIAALGDLVRDAFTGMDELQPFKVEVAWLRRYAEILESRHRGLLSFRWDLAPETLATLTPRLLLQPLVENAVKHGALRRREGGSVLIRSESLGGGIVRLVVEDNGPGFGSDSAERLGITLVRRRLGLMCPGGSLHIEPIDPGTRAVVEIQQAMEGCA